MGVFRYESEDAFSLPPARMFNALVLESDHLLPKIFPDNVKSIEVLEGDGGAGSITKLTFVEGGNVGYVKHKIEEVDKENFKTSYSVIEGDVLGDKLEKISNEIQWVPSPDGGSICKSVSECYTKGDFEIPEELLKAGKEKSMAMAKAVEAYLQANPN